MRTETTEGPLFDGPEFNEALDGARLRGQIGAIHELMSDQGWRTLREIEKATGYPQSSISAQLRHLRKERFGSHMVDKRRRGERTQGLFEYQVI